MLTIGRKTVTWGQFDIFSPVDIVLPYRFISQEINVEKSANREPQDLVILSLYPTPYLEIEGYYFPWINLDPEFERVVHDYEEKNDLSFSVNDQGVVELIHGRLPIDIPKRYDDLRNNYQFASRILLYLDVITVGFTFFHGFEYLFPTRNQALTPLTNELQQILAAPLEDVNSQYILTRRVSLYRYNNYGLELSVPWKEWTFKMELTYALKQGTVIPGYLVQVEEGLNWVISENSSSLILKENQLFYGIEVHANYKHWFMNLVILRLDNFYTGKHRRGIELFQKIERDILGDPGEIGAIGEHPKFGGEVFTDTIPIFPVLNVGWYITEDKNHILGLVGGLLLGGLAQGGILYFIQELFDDTLRWAVSFDVLRNQGDRLLGDGSELPVKGGINLGGRAVISYTLWPYLIFNEHTNDPLFFYYGLFVVFFL